ncbi:MAG TPA: exo-beta-N-acetylmuramidase NamZ domain-containing protein [Candidatus Angelobacter sp.]|nr:exo-beta-N-acetylmuramidase NamZ domain-containing protein [Candidatus Angelobacter sp.]
MRKMSIVLLPLLVVFCAWCAPASLTAALPPAGSPYSAFHTEKLAEMDAAIERALADHDCPGVVLWLERNDAAYHKAYGKRALVPAGEPMTEDTIFDAASLTKVIATTPAVMLLIERGKVRLDERVQAYIPEFTGEGKEAVTIRQLMTHTSGLRPDISTQPPWSGYDTAIRMACAEKLLSAPGAVFRYSDINFFMLGEVVRRVSGLNLNEFVAREIYGPLKMADTGFLPPASKLPRIAPTEKVNGRVLRGTVHDPTARFMGGVAGHAGLFTTAADLARYARMLLNLGELDGVRIFKPETVRLMTSVQSPEGVPARRGLGWDIDSGYSRPRGKIFPPGSYGHTGFTGTALWIDPFSKTFWIFLSNRVHPDGKGNVLGLEGELASLAGQAVIGFNFSYVPGSLTPRPAEENAIPAKKAASLKTVEVHNGIDGLAKRHFAPLKGLRVGLITNHTGQDRERNPTIDLLKNAPDVRLRALFSPEHGIRGALDEKVGDSTDEKTGLPVFSLYGARRAPSPEQLKDLDALVFDIQDIGCRFYTYIATLGNCLEAAGQARLKFLVLDRVNPINGTRIEGPVYRGESSFTAFHSLPLRTGMTMGELAKMFNAERGFDADLTVVPIEGWTRDLWFDQTRLPWTNPSPNMRNLTEAILYPGVGLLETAVSVGRGTDTPFEVVGAPYVDDVKLAAELNRANLPGIRFVPVRFEPTASVFKDKSCGGVYLMVTDRDALEAVDVGITLALALQRLYPKDFALEKVQHLLQDPPTLDAIKAGKTLSEIKQLWANDLDEFRKRREKFLIYR